MAVRDATIQSLDEALRLLPPWAADPDPNIRRFASELTRPRGVWCAQIERLKAEPWAGVKLLEPLRADPSRYVQNSVANWLNDASRSQPAWVEETCGRWLAESDAAETRYIVRRALRTLSKRQAEEP
jgi:3-methyladenine DNA glycosylase AlkC